MNEVNLDKLYLTKENVMTYFNNTDDEIIIACVKTNDECFRVLLSNTFYINYVDIEIQVVTMNGVKLYFNDQNNKIVKTMHIDIDNIEVADYLDVLKLLINSNVKKIIGDKNG